jgi:tetratricopeptide (TPR) repeat protein
MDLTTLGAVLLFALGLLGADTVMHSGSINMEIVPGVVDGVSLDKTTVEHVIVDEIARVGRIGSIMQAPQVRMGNDKGVGMALAEAANVKAVAFALQRQFGYDPDRLRFALYSEGGVRKALITGTSNRMSLAFEDIVIQKQGESYLDMLKRSALVGISRMDPYFATLFLITTHQESGTFNEAIELARHSIADLPATTVNPGRSAFQNLLGIVNLFEQKPAEAKRDFEAAIASNPANAVAQINGAFADLILNEYSRAAARMNALLTRNPPSNNVLRSTAYATWGAALLGMRRADEADRMMERAVDANPTAAAVLTVWADVKEQLGYPDDAVDLRRRAFDSSAVFENYAEVAALYFKLPWREDEPVTRSRFGNPNVVSFR